MNRSPAQRGLRSSSGIWRRSSPMCGSSSIRRRRSCGSPRRRLFRTSRARYRRRRGSCWSRRSPMRTCRIAAFSRPIGTTRTSSSTRLRWQWWRRPTMCRSSTSSPRRSRPTRGFGHSHGTVFISTTRRPARRHRPRSTAVRGRPASVDNETLLNKLRGEVNEKNLQFWYDYRAVNGYYIYGGRKNPFGIVNFPAEFAKLRKMIAVRDERIWDVAQGKTSQPTIDDTGTGDFTPIETNFKNEVVLTTPEESLATSSSCRRATRSTCSPRRTSSPICRSRCSSRSTRRAGCGSTTMPSYPVYLPGHAGQRQDSDPRRHQRRRPGRQADRLRRRAARADRHRTRRRRRVRRPAAEPDVPQGHQRRRRGRRAARSCCTASTRPTRTTRSRVHVGSGRGAVLQGRDVPSHAGRNAVRPAALCQRRRVPLRAADGEVRRLRLVRLRQSVGAHLRSLGAELRGRRLRRGQLLRHRVLRRRRLSPQARRPEAVPRQAVAADLRLRARLQPALPRRDARATTCSTTASASRGCCSTG